MKDDVGATIGDYQIVGVLGAGGMGKVYKVRNIISDRVEAMKVLLPNLDTDHELAERFIREIKVQASLQHPNIASLHTAQRVDNQLLMIMEFVEGETLEFLMRQGRIPLRDSVNYVSQVLSALSYAHAHGVVHRDIKPPNMMLTPDGIVKLMDFGIAKISVDHKLTQTGKTVGSLFYMSPEQIRGSDVDARSDLYSLGISMYEMVTGKRPFEGESDYSIMAAHLQQPPQPPVAIDPSVPPALNEVILISIAKDPGQRFQTADAFRSALQSVAHELGVGASAASNVATTQLFARPAPPPTGPRPAPSPTHRTETRAEIPASPAPPSQWPQRMPSQPQAPAMPPSAPPQFQPHYQPMPPQAMASMQPTRSHRGLYMVLGSVLTIGILAGAALYLPKLWKTGASSGPTQIAQTKPLQTTPVQTTPVQTTPVQTQPVQTQPVQTVPPQNQAVQKPPVQPPVVRTAPVRIAPVETPRIRTAPARTPVDVPARPLEPAPQSPAVQHDAMPQPNVAPPANNPANSELEELRHRRGLLGARVEAVNDSIKDLQESQRRMGLTMNGDIVARHHRIGFYMETADAAIHSGNIAEARTSLNNAEHELEGLEKRFGR